MVNDIEMVEVLVKCEEIVIECKLVIDLFL